MHVVAETVITKMNAIPLTVDLFKLVLRAVGDLPAAARADLSARTLAMSEVLERDKVPGNHAEILLAVKFRVEALAGLSDEPAFGAWSTRAGIDGGDLVQEILIEIAATQPLIARDGKPAFEAASFFAAALAQGAAEGRA
jgi:hypothetical protein